MQNRKRKKKKNRIRFLERNLTPEEKRITRKKRMLDRSVKAAARRLKKNEHRLKSHAFLRSPEWAVLRYETLKRFGQTCMACGAKAPDVVIHVDHIKPRYLYPDLALDPSNLQVLCELCNIGKGARHEDDFRSEDREPLLEDFKACKDPELAFNQAYSLWLQTKALKDL